MLTCKRGKIMLNPPKPRVGCYSYLSFFVLLVLTVDICHPKSPVVCACISFKTI